uniref:Orphan peptide AbOp-3 n=1 Tax=Androctonus bicolor TaxID=748906 RepID=A0A0K0LC36_9SCOR|nr:orphan peptide AbOp-3 [Androctonus bicolor]
MKTTGIVLFVCAIIYSLYLEAESASIYPSELQSNFHKLRKRQIHGRFGDYIPRGDLAQGKVSTGVEMFFPVDDDDGEDTDDNEGQASRSEDDDVLTSRRAAPRERGVKCNKRHH